MSQVDGRVPARRARFYGASTEAVRPHERFEYWRALFGDPDMSPIPKRDARPYRGWVIGCDGDDGLLFTELDCAPTAARFDEGHADYLRLAVLSRGALRVTHGNDVREVGLPGAGIELFDARRAARIESVTGYRSHFITVPRALAVETLGIDPTGDRAHRALPETPLSLLLKAQLTAFSRLGPAMDAREVAAAMASLSGLTIAYLRRFRPAARQEEGAAADAALFAAARSYIAAHKESPGLTAVRVAGAIGCSRNHLFRIFRARGLTIAEEIRAARLGHARALLRDPRLDIGDIALRCGYSDGSAFGKAFRRRFGMSPGDWRAGG